MARSLLDTVDVARVRHTAAAAGGDVAGTAALACLLVGGALQHDPDDPAWADRDRLVVGGGDLDAAAAAVFAAAGVPTADTAPRWLDAGPGALAVAYGLAAGSALDGGVWRAYAVLDAGACADGVVWEAACAAAGARVPLTALVSAADRDAADRATGLFDSAGWPVSRVTTGDVVAVLADLDRALASAVPAVVVERP